MIISHSKTMTHHPAQGIKTDAKEEFVQAKVAELIEHIGIDSSDVQWNEEGHLVLNKTNNLKLHSLMLQMEQCGLDLKMTRQTLIEVH